MPSPTSYHHILKLSFIAWLIFRLCAMPFVMLSSTQTGGVIGFVFWQILVLLPALIALPFILKGKSAYALIVISLMMMVYWGVSASFLLIAWYEKAPMLLIGAYGVETMLLAAVFFALFVFLRKMPAMYKNS